MNFSQSRLNAIAAPTPLEITGLADRIRGMLLGIAIGDSLGNSSESKLPAKRTELYGHINDYLPNRYLDGQRVGTPSDDTQLSFWTVEHLLEHGHLEPDALSTLFASRHIYGRGKATGDFVHARRSGAPWEDAGQPSAGNGALMRIAPMVLPELSNGRKALWTETATSASITHNDPLAIASAVAFVSLLWQLLGNNIPSTPNSWLDAYLGVLRPLDHDQVYETRVLSGPMSGWRGATSSLLDGPVRSAIALRTDARTAGNSWYSGAYLLETVPTVVYILALHGHDPVAAVESAVNDTRDNDTIASIVGAAMGAAYGTAWIPQRWREGLLGRTGADDDGRVFALIDAAIERFVPRAV